MNGSLNYKKTSKHDFANILLRFVLGGLMLYHGMVKIISFNDISPYFPSLFGIGNKVELILVILSECICGLLVIIGFKTKIASIPLFTTMFVAYFIVHTRDPFQEKELAFIFMLLSIITFVSGSGKLSIDYLINKQHE